MKTLTVVILYNEKTKNNIPNIKNYLGDRIYKIEDEVNFIEVEGTEDNFVVQKDFLEKLDSKFLYVINANDVCELSQIVIGDLKEKTDYKLFYNNITVKYQQDYIEILPKKEFSIYDKIIEVEYLKSLISDKEETYKDILYNNFKEDEAYYSFALYYTIIRDYPKVFDEEDEEEDDDEDGDEEYIEPPEESQEVNS